MVDHVLKRLQVTHAFDRLMVHKMLLKPFLRHLELIFVCRQPLSPHSRPFADSARFTPSVHLLATGCAPSQPIPESAAFEIDPGQHAHLATPSPKVPVTSRRRCGYPCKVVQDEHTEDKHDVHGCRPTSASLI